MSSADLVQVPEWHSPVVLNKRFKSKPALVTTLISNYIGFSMPMGGVVSVE